MSEEEIIPLKATEELDAFARAEEENRARGEEIAGSYLRRFVCTVCHERETLATAEQAAKAVCGPCLAARTGGGGVAVGVPLRPVVGYPMGSDTRVAPARERHPAPLVSSRDVVRPDQPGPVLALAEYAAEAGWSVLTQYARGRSVHSTTGRPTALVDSWAVRVALGDKHAFAVYMAGTWKYVWIFGPAIPPFGKAGVTELKQWLYEHGDLPTEWFAEISKKVVAAEKRKKIKAACDRGSHADVEKRGALAFCPHCEHEWPATAAPWRKPKKAKEGAS